MENISYRQDRWSPSPHSWASCRDILRLWSRQGRSLISDDTMILQKLELLVPTYHDRTRRQKWLQSSSTFLQIICNNHNYPYKGYMLNTILSTSWHHTLTSRCGIVA
jgi:hypothetical protein